MAEPTQSIIFVVDGKELETKSLLLAASLARHHAAGPDLRLIAYLTHRSLLLLDPATRALYEACGVELARLPAATGGLWAQPYPHGNKILAAAQPRTSQRTTFLDTDMFCQSAITGIDPIDPYEVFVVPEGRRTWGKNPKHWLEAYRFFDLPLPQETITLLRGQNARSLPYFNAGFISFSDLPLDDQGKSFGQLWLEAASDFDWLARVPDKRPWLDQITLPLVMADYGLDCLILPEAYNYAIHNRADLSALADAKMIHYHHPGFFLALPQAQEEIERMISLVAPQHRDALDLLLAVHFNHDPVTDPARPAPQPLSAQHPVAKSAVQTMQAAVA